MSGSGKAGNGPGNNNRRRSGKRRDKDNNYRGDGKAPSPHNQNRGAANPENRGSSMHGQQGQENQNRNRPGFHKRSQESRRGGKPSFFERPKWVPPKFNFEPLPVPDCPWCGKPIRDISNAITDKDTETPVHFECVTARISDGELLESGDIITYIGGGRFGIVCFSGPGNSQVGRDFKIKKVIEWENKDKRADWRSSICERYSVG